MEWLRSDIEQLDQIISMSKDELTRLLADPETREQRRHLACPEQHAKIKETINNRAREYEEQANRLEKELAVLFKENDS